MGDSSCLDDARANAAVPPRKHCRGVLLQLLRYYTLERNVSLSGLAAFGARPALLSHVQPLRTPFSDDLGVDKSPEARLTDKQNAAFTSHSHVMGRLLGCTTSNSSCMLPLVPQPPRWVAAAAPSGDQARRIASYALSGSGAERSGFSSRSSLGGDLPFRLDIIAVPAVGATIGLALLLWSHLPRRRRARVRRAKTADTRGRGE